MLRGRLTPSPADFDGWLNVQLGSVPKTNFEDPVEDVFIANVTTQEENRNIFTGVWETPDFWLQQFVDVLLHAPSQPTLNQLRAEINALLKLGQ
jgi:hypothetical protein